jgi:hypothetical protein
MEVRDTGCQLPKNAEHFLVGKLILTELFPRRNVVRRLRLEHQSLNFVNQHHRLKEVHNVRVIHLLHLADEVHGVLEFLLEHIGDVDKNSHTKNVSFRVPLYQDFTLVLGRV